MTNYAFVFPGQGSQVAGMGADLADHPAAKAVFGEADAVLGFSLSDLMFRGAQAELDETQNTQPALYTVGAAFYGVLQQESAVEPMMMAGHSLGELTALYAAGAMTFADGLRLVAERGRLMAGAGEAQPGAMAAVLGLDVGAVRAVCAEAAGETGGVLVLANDNCPGQVVISGDVATLERGLALAKMAGAKRAVKLAVSIAAHSPLMQPAADAFRRAVEATPITQPRVPVIGNVTAAPLESVEAIREELSVQLTRSVRWTESVRAMIVAGVEHFVELGPKDVLTGLLKRIDGTAAGTAVNTYQILKNFTQL